MSENFIHKTLTLYVHIQKYVKRKLIAFRPVGIARAATDVF